MREAAQNRPSLTGPQLDFAASVSHSPDEQGSGFIIDDQGFILTCHHVVAAADVLFVELADGRKLEAVEVWGDPATDIAVIRIEAGGELDAVKLGNSNSVEVGDWVMSLASPYDLKRSISAGIVSITECWVSGTPHPLIQNDAATNPGSSGGALINLQGEVVGIVIGGLSTAKEFQGIGLAVPINTAKRIADELRARGSIERGYLGYETQMLSPEIAKLLELPVAGGLYVKDVKKASPAERAGIATGDIITHFDGQPIDDTFRPQRLYLDPRPGETHTFAIHRDGQSVVVKAKMEHRPAPNAMENAPPPMVGKARTSEYFDKSLGMGLDKLTAAEAHELELPNNIQGVLINQVASRSISYVEGLAAGMAVLRIDNHPIRNLDDYRDATIKHQPEQPMLMLVQSNQGRYLVVFEKSPKPKKVRNNLTQ